MAYARLGTVYVNLGQTDLSEENRRKAFELRERASEREKLYIMSHYYVRLRATRQRHHRARTLQTDLSAGHHPPNNLANVYNQLGQFENALENARKAVELDPDSVSGYSNVGFAYAGLNRLDEAKATFKEALQHKAGGTEPILHWP